MEIKKSQKADLEKLRGVFFLTGLLLVLAFILAAFNFTSYPKEDEVIVEEAEEVVEEEMTPVTRPETEPPPPPPEKPEVVTEFEEVEDDKVVEEFTRTDFEVDEETEIEVEIFEEEEEVVEEQVFVIVEDMPSFQGKGKEGFRDYIFQKLKYPEVAREMGISGTVYVQFVVNQTGYVQDAKVVRGVDPALDKEALRVVNSSPQWAPGKQRGKAVKVQFVFPIKFVLQ